MIKISKIRLSIILLIVVLLLTSTSCTSCINKYTEIAEQSISISNSIIVYDLIKKTNESKNLIGDENE